LSKCKVLLFTLLLLSCSSNTDSQTGTEVSNDSVNSVEVSLDLETQVFDVPVFVYHRFGDDRYPSTNISLGTFREHLKYLTQKGYRAISLSELDSLLRSGDLQEKVCVITIDDGYRSVERGVEILDEFGFTATVFVNTETVGAGDYLDWNQLQSFLDRGFEIGNHTHSHPFLLNFPDDERLKKLEIELESSQKIFRQQLNYVPVVFAYPYGEGSKEMARYLKIQGFSMACAQNSGVFNETSDRFLIPRFPINEFYGTMDKFRERLSMHGLRFTYVSEYGNEYQQNPPKLILKLQNRSLDLEPSQMQLFVGGRKEDISIDGANITLQSSRPLRSRRILYTVTGRDSRGQWYWFSHPWFDPSIPDQ